MREVYDGSCDHPYTAVDVCLDCEVEHQFVVCIDCDTILEEKE
jgi:hypothetical protein